MHELTVPTCELSELHFRLIENAPGDEALVLVECSWGSFFPVPTPVEDWQDDLLDGQRLDGSAQLCLGRWHELAADETERLLNWLAGLLTEEHTNSPAICLLERPGPRSRPSGLAERTCATLAPCH